MIEAGLTGVTSELQGDSKFPGEGPARVRAGGEQVWDAWEFPMVGKGLLLGLQNTWSSGQAEP